MSVSDPLLKLLKSNYRDLSQSAFYRTFANHTKTCRNRVFKKCFGL